MPTQQSNKRVNLLFSVLEATFFPIMFVTDGLFSQFLNMLGYGDSFIGVLLMAMGVSCLVVQPIFGYYCDKVRNYRGLFLFVYFLLLGSMPIFFRYGNQKWVAIGYSVIAMGTSKALFSILDSWISKLQRENYEIDYGKIRSVGSMSYAVGAAVLSQIIVRMGNSFSTVLCIGLFCIMLPALIMLPNPTHDDTLEKISVKQASGVLFKNKNYVVFLICCFLVSITNTAILVFSSRYYASLGGNVGHIGIASFTMAFFEFFVIVNFTKIVKRFGTAKVLGIGMLGTALKAVIYWSCPNITWAIIATIAQTFSYALLFPGSVTFISEQIPRAYLATALVMYQTLCQSLAQILGSPVYGALSEKYSVSTMFLIVSVPGFIGGALFMIYCKRNGIYQKAIQSVEECV